VPRVCREQHTAKARYTVCLAFAWAGHTANPTFAVCCSRQTDWHTAKAGSPVVTLASINCCVYMLAAIL